MKIIKPSFEIETPINGEEILKHLEKVGRVCYRSENLITEDSAKKFVANIISRGHEAIIEHFNITVRIICDRGVSHEIVRHRIASYAQESQRYVNYNKDKFGKEITVIDPISGFKWDLNNAKDLEKYWVWKSAMNIAEDKYMQLVELGATPQEARSVLPNSTKTEIIMTLNLREWRHFFKLRTAKAAHPSMREIAIPLLNKFKELIPVVFDDIEVEE